LNCIVNMIIDIVHKLLCWWRHFLSRMWNLRSCIESSFCTIQLLCYVAPALLPTHFTFICSFWSCR
jgi:hypothetical protein